MTVAIRKRYVAGTIVLILCLANLNAFVSWLYAIGLIPWAQRVCDEYLTGTAITVIVAILIVVPSSSVVATCVCRCRVCDALLLRRGRYCPDCGSRV